MKNTKLENQAAKTMRESFFTCEIFAKVKEYLKSAKRSDPPVVSTAENFCEYGSSLRKIRIGMPVKSVQPVETDNFGYSQLVDKIMKEKDSE